MKIIMYHYVQRFEDSLPYLNFLHIQDFKKQLDYFQKNYYFPSYNEVLQYINKQISLPEKSIVLTFDDGLKCHYEYVLPELKMRNLWGIFYIPAGPYINKKMLNVHKVHLILGKFPANVVYDELMIIIGQENDDITIKDNINILYENQKNEINYTTIKKLLNYYIKPEYKSNIIDKIFNHFFKGVNETEIVSEFYLSLDEIKDLDSCDMIIGNHSIDHLVFSQMSYSEQYRQIKKSSDFLSNVIKKSIDSFCYPYGGRHVYNADTIKILKDLEIKFAVDVYLSDTKHLNAYENKYTIYRYDCNSFMHGKVFNYSNEAFSKPMYNTLNINFKNNMKYNSITVFTSNHPRHISLVNKLSLICNNLYAVIECSTIFKKREGIMKDYFLRVNNSEQKIFGDIKFLSNNIHVMPVLYNDISKMDVELLENGAKSDLFIVYGSSWIKGDMGDFLEKKNAINIHLGVSPYYRGTATTFWPLYDGNYEYVGGTIHSLTKKLDAGKIFYTVLPKIIKCDNTFDFTMMISEITQNVLIEKLKNYEIWRMKPLIQNNTDEIRNCKSSDFTEEIAEKFLNNIPNMEDIIKKQGNINYNIFTNAILKSINL